MLLSKYSLIAYLLPAILCAASLANAQERSAAKWEKLAAHRSHSKESSQNARKIAKMDPAIKSWLETHHDELIPVMLYLADQPINRVKPELERRHSFRRLAIEANFEQASRSRDLDSIRSVLEADAEFTLQFRRELLATLKRDSEPAQREIEILLTSVRAQNIRSLYVLNIVRADVPRDALPLLEQDPRISEVSVEQPVEAQVSTSTAAVGAPNLWSLGYTGAGDSVLILDSGINASHPAFGNRVRTGIFLENNAQNCSTTERTSPWDFQGHGSHVAGIIASAGTASFPSYRGVAWGVSTIYSAKISCENGRSTYFDPLQAVQTALDTTPIRVVNNSNGALQTLVDDDAYSRRVDELIDRYDLTWVNSAGNSGSFPGALGSPGIAYNVISVANVDTFGIIDRNVAQIARSSSRGPTIGGRFKPDIAAPGQNIWSMAHDSVGFALKSGTSMAAPHIAGAAVLLRQRGVIDRLRIKALLLNTTDQVGWNAAWGWGYVNLTRAESQADFGVDGRLATATGSVQLFRGTVPAGRRLFATLVWNRYVRPGISYLRDLDFALYRQSDGSVLDESNLSGHNVEQLAGPEITVATPVVIKVSAGNSGFGVVEPFAIALSEAGFQSAAGINLSTSCVLPTSVAPSSVVSVNCTFRNTGDLPSFATSYSLGFVGGAVPAPISLGPILPSASIVRTLNVVAPANGGAAEILVRLTGSAYGVVANAPDVRYPIQIVVPNLSITPTSAAVPSTSSTGTFSVVATPANVGWTAFSNADWISITGGSPGVGNGRVSFLVAANTGATPRTGTITAAGRTFSVSQSASVVPSATDSGPLAGSGLNQTLSFRFSHPQGFANLGILNVLINRALDGGNACYVAYSQPAGVLFLVNDAGPDSGLSEPLVLGSSAMVSNSQCTIRGTGSSAVGSGNVFNLTLNISFTSSFRGSKVIYTAARDNGAANSGWKTIGSSQIPEVSPALPRTDPLAPSTASAANQTITASYRSATGITTTWLLVNTAVNASQACYIAYFAPGNLLLLLPDNGDGANAVAMPLTGNNMVENSQCRVNAQGSTASSVGGVLTLSLNITMKPAFSGPRGVWTALQDTSGQVSPWRIAGAWLVP